MNLTHINAKVGMRICATDWASVPKGWEGTVTRVDGVMVEVRWDKGETYRNGYWKKFRTHPHGTDFHIVTAK